MSSFHDEIEIQEAAVRAAFAHLGLDRLGGVLFLSVSYEDERGLNTPPNKLMERLADLPLIRPSSRGRRLPPAQDRPRYTMVDKVTGEMGWGMVTGTTKWHSDGTADVRVLVHRVVQSRLAFDRGETLLAFAAIARRHHERWELEIIDEGTHGTAPAAAG